MDTTRADMTQAILEGVAFGLRDSLEVARSLGINIERTKICGGGAKSPLWKKIIANVMDLKVDVPENEEGPSMGGAMLAAVGCGEYPDVETICNKLVRVVDTVEPEPELVAKYEEKYRKFNKEDKASFDLYAGQEVKNKLIEFNVVKKNTFISGLYVGEDPDSLNNSINKAKKQLIESMRNDLKIEKS